MSRSFSDFIRNATPEEKAEVYGEVMKAATLTQRAQAHGCRKSAIANMDHVKGFHPDLQPTINRMCTTCGHHWYGPVGAATEYTRAQWDAWVATAFDGDQP